MEGRTKVGIFWKRLLLLVYSLVLLVVFVYMRFPYDSIKTRMEDYMSSFTGRQVEIETVKPCLIPGLVLKDVSLDKKPLFDNLLLRPSPVYLLHGNLALGIKAWTKTGCIKGDIQIPVRKVTKSLKVDLEIENLDVSEFSKFLDKAGKLEGKINGSISMKGTRAQFYKASGNAHLVVNGLAVPVVMPMTPLETLRLRHGTIDVHMAKGTLVIDRCVFSGPDVSGSLGGQLRLSRYISRSRLSVTGNIKFAPQILARLPLKAYLRGGRLKFTLTGTLKYPRYRIITG